MNEMTINCVTIWQVWFEYLVSSTRRKGLTEWSCNEHSQSYCSTREQYCWMFGSTLVHHAELTAKALAPRLSVDAAWGSRYRDCSTRSDYGNGCFTGHAPYEANLYLDVSCQIFSRQTCCDIGDVIKHGWSAEIGCEQADRIAVPAFRSLNGSFSNSGRFLRSSRCVLVTEATRGTLISRGVEVDRTWKRLNEFVAERRGQYDSCFLDIYGSWSASWRWFIETSLIARYCVRDAEDNHSAVDTLSSAMFWYATKALRTSNAAFENLAFEGTRRTARISWDATLFKYAGSDECGSMERGLMGLRMFLKALKKPRILSWPSVARKLQTV